MPMVILSFASSPAWGGGYQKPHGGLRKKAACAAAVQGVKADVLHAVALLRPLAVVEAVECAHQVTRDAADALEAHARADGFRGVHAVASFFCSSAFSRSWSRQAR